jgi:hypothetical protein
MTIQEIETREKALHAEMTAALEGAKGKKPASAEFDEAYGKYLAAKANLAKIPAELAKAKAEANSGALKSVGETVAQAIAKLVEGLKVAELLGEPVKVVRYIVGEDGVAVVGFNPTTRIATKGPKGERKTGNGHVAIIAPDGSKQSLTKFVLAHATDAEKASKEFKYPHSQVDTKPKFDAFCASHNLTGFVYEVPEATS